MTQRFASRLTPAWFAAGVLGLTCVGVALGDLVPWTDDARFYVTAAARQATWLEQVVRFDGAAWSRPSLDEVFGLNHEHPPVAKLGMALATLVLHRWLGLMSDIEACRAFVSLLWAGTVTGLVAWLWRWAGAGAALIGAASFVLLPRMLFEAHAETLDMPVTALSLLSAWALFEAWEAPRPGRIALAVGLYGLALGTKLNAPFVLLAAVAYGLLYTPPRLERRAGATPLLRLPPIPWALAGMVLVSPLIAWALWPWLWFDTLARLNAYLLFHLQHYGIHFYYRGALYGAEPAPWHAPWMMTALTVPLPVLVLAGLGAAPPAAAALGRLPLVRRWLGLVGARLDDSAVVRLGLFALLQALVQLGAASLPGVPKYGGVKLFLPAFPFLAMLAGLGWTQVQWELERIRREWRRGLSVAAGAAALLPGLLGSVLYAGTWLSYYNGVAGGLRGATAAGYERQYYDLAYPELWRALAAATPPAGLAVAFAPNPKEYTSHVARAQRQGLLPATVRLAPIDQADVLVLTHERRWAEYAELMAQHRSVPLLARYEVAGVPLFSVFDLRHSVAVEGH